MARADRAAIKVTSILNGAFLDMLGAEMPIIQRRIHRVLYWHDVNQLLDFTTKDDVAAFTAAAALDEATPRILRVAGDSVSARNIADILTDVTGRTYSPLWVGSLGLLGGLIAVAKIVAPQSKEPFPPWQGMQYMRDQFSGHAKFIPTDNGGILNCVGLPCASILTTCLGPAFNRAEQRVWRILITLAISPPMARRKVFPVNFEAAPGGRKSTPPRRDSSLRARTCGSSV